MKNLISILVITVVLSASLLAQLNSPDHNLQANGPVNCIVVDGDFTYIGGYFTYVGVNTGYGAKLSTTTHTPDLTFPKVNGEILVVVPDGSGGWLIGGSFTKVGNYIRNRIARINSDGSVDENWNPNANNWVRSILINGTDVYVGGSFTSIGGQPRNYAAKLSSITGNADPIWNPNPSGDVWAFAISGSDIYVGGGFTTIGGQSRNRIAKLNSTDGTADLNWNANANNGVGTIAISGSDIYVTGDFTTIGGLTRSRIAKLNNTDGAADINWNANANNGVGTLAISGSDIYVGGNFTTIGGLNRSRIAKLNITDGTVDPIWNPNATGPTGGAVHVIKVSGNIIYVGGDFTTIGGHAITRIGRLNNTDGSADPTWNPYAINTNGLNALGTVSSIAINDNDIYIGGLFTSVGGYTRNRIARLFSTSGLVDPNWNPNANDWISAIAISGTDIYVAGGFTTINGQSRNRIAKLNDTNGNVDPIWNPNADNFVNTLAVSGSDIYVGGAFTTIGGQSRNRIAKLNSTDGAADLNWNPNANNFINTVAVSGSNIYVGGVFTTIGGQSRNRIAKLNSTDGAADLNWNPNANGNIRAIKVNGNDIYVGGGFTTISGQSRNRLTKLNDTNGIADPMWNPNANNEVYTLAISGNDICVGGNFTTIKGQSRIRIAKLNNFDGTAYPSWNPSTNFTVSVIANNGNDIYVGGNFTLINQDPHTFAALFRSEFVNTTPIFVSPTPSCGNVFTVDIGHPLSFTVAAQDADAGDMVSLSVIGLPSGSSMSPVLPASGNPASSDFSWTPTLADVGTYNLTYEITDNQSAPVSCSFTIEVINDNVAPVFVEPTPTCGTTLNAYVGEEFSFTVNASDVDAGDILNLSSGNLPTGAVMNPELPMDGNPISSQFFWTPDLASVGTHTVTYAVTDNYSDPVICSFSIEVINNNIAPVFISPTPACDSTLTADVGSPFSFTITAEDVNIGDVVVLSSSTLPVGSTMDPVLPLTGNPVTSLFSWAPTSADIGMHQIVYTISDIQNYQTVCSLTVEVVDVPPPPQMPCPLSQGYWKNHTGNWPASAVPMMLGTTNSYDDLQLLSIFNSAVRGDASIILAHQLIAAKLNVANGSPVPVSVANAITDADAAIADLVIPAGIKSNSSLRSTMISLAAILDDYNNGLLTTDCTQMGKNGLSELEPVTEYALFSNFPNPFNPTTKISWQAPVDGHQSLKVYDVLGNEVAVLVDEFRIAGRYEATFDASNLASGIYVYRLQAGEFMETKKMILMK